MRSGFGAIGQAVARAEWTSRPHRAVSQGPTLVGFESFEVDDLRVENGRERAGPLRSEASLNFGSGHIVNHIMALTAAMDIAARRFWPPSGLTSNAGEAS